MKAVIYNAELGPKPVRVIHITPSCAPTDADQEDALFELISAHLYAEKFEFTGIALVA